MPGKNWILRSEHDAMMTALQATVEERTKQRDTQQYRAEVADEVIKRLEAKLAAMRQVLEQIANCDHYPNRSDAADSARIALEQTRDIEDKEKKQ